MRSPIGMPWSAIWMPPNHMIATIERLSTRVSAGIMSAKRRLTLSVVHVRSWLAASKRSSS